MRASPVRGSKLLQIDHRAIRMVPPTLGVAVVATVVVGTVVVTPVVGAVVVHPAKEIPASPALNSAESRRNLRRVYRPYLIIYTTPWLIQIASNRQTNVRYKLCQPFAHFKILPSYLKLMKKPVNSPERVSIVSFQFIVPNVVH